MWYSISSQYYNEISCRQLIEHGESALAMGEIGSVVTPLAISQDFKYPLRIELTFGRMRLLQ